MRESAETKLDAGGTERSHAALVPLKHECKAVGATLCIWWLCDAECEVSLEAVRDGERPMEPRSAGNADTLARRRELKSAPPDLSLACAHQSLRQSVATWLHSFLETDRGERRRRVVGRVEQQKEFRRRAPSTEVRPICWHTRLRRRRQREVECMQHLDGGGVHRRHLGSFDLQATYFARLGHAQKARGRGRLVRNQRDLVPCCCGPGTITKERVNASSTHEVTARSQSSAPVQANVRAQRHLESGLGEHEAATPLQGRGSTPAE